MGRDFSSFTERDKSKILGVRPFINTDLISFGNLYVNGIKDMAIIPANYRGLLNHICVSFTATGAGTAYVVVCNSSGSIQYYIARKTFSAAAEIMVSFVFTMPPILRAGDRIRIYSNNTSIRVEAWGAYYLEPA